MKIAVISDTHDNLINLEKTISWLKKGKIKILIHCGDICAPATSKAALKDFIGQIHLIFSNVDEDFFRITKLSFKDLPKIKVWGELGEIKINNKKIAFTHFPEFAQGLADTGKYDLVFYGHTHKPWEEKINKTRLINPGNLAGLFYKATFAVYDTQTDKLELKILEDLK